MKPLLLVAAILATAASGEFLRAADLNAQNNFCPLPPAQAAPRDFAAQPRDHVDFRPNVPSDPATGDTVLYDFRADWCGPCRSMDPVVGQLAGQGYPIRRINIDQDHDLAVRFGVQGIPCFVMVVNGKEVDRVVGATNVGRLEAMFSRNGVAAMPNSVRGQSPDARRPRLDSASADLSQAVPFPLSNTGGAIPRDASPYAAAAPNSGVPAPDRGTSPDEATGQQTRWDPLVRASVRLRIEDETGNSVGSGTIIDARAGEALILTCGHMFRDAVKDGRIAVDLFGPSAPHGVPGKLIDFDLKSEVGLISIRTNYPVVAAHLAPPGYVVHPGDRVISVGCDGGADATARQTSVTSINRYLGAANLQVAFQPVQGRSGGGLFTPSGFVVGVCYAADPEGHEGLFSALPALCDELNHFGLGFVCRDQADGLRHSVADEMESNLGGAGSGNALAAVRNPPANRWVNAENPLQNSQLPPSEGRQRQARDHQTAALASLSADEQTTLAALREKSDDSEVICIVRPGSSSTGKSEIVVLDHVAPGFIERLAAERPENNGRQLTSLEMPRNNPPASPVVNRGDAHHLAPSSGSNASPAAPQAGPKQQLQLTPWWSDLVEPAAK